GIEYVSTGGFNVAKFPITLPSDAQAGDIIVIRWLVVDGSTIEACPSGNSNVYCDILFRIIDKPFCTVTAKVAGSGRVTINSKSSPQDVPLGQRVVFTAIPEHGACFVNWTRTDGTSITDNPYTIENIQLKDFEITADFAEDITKEITTNQRESSNAAYNSVVIKSGVAGPPTWTIENYDIKVGNMDVIIGKDGVTPEIDVAGGALTVGHLAIKRVVDSKNWTLLTLPFDINLRDITIDGIPANYGVNIKLQVYDAAKRARESRENWTISGWTFKTEGVIAANTGFAVAVNANDLKEHTVAFYAANHIFNGSDKTLSLERHLSTVNKGMDADWNFMGNPTLLTAHKGDGYSLYIYNSKNNSYDEYGGFESANYSPFASWFVQSANDFTSMTFRHGVPVNKLVNSADSYEKITLAINGDDDEIRMTVKDGTSLDYVKNEDAMYFAPNTNNLSQLYMIDNAGCRIASSFVPIPYSSIKLGYKALVAGEQVLTLKSTIKNTAVYLKDNVTFSEIKLGEGDSYKFTSAVGVNENRLELKTIVDPLGIFDAEVNGAKISIVVSGNSLIITGAHAGDQVIVATPNGATVAQTITQEGITTLDVAVKGVIIVKIGSVAVKVIK
ncbi:MAG: hypothetical protein RR341_07495, partial [Bacteroidales bacterium]